MLPSNLPHPFALLYQRRKALKHFRFRGQSHRQTFSTRPFSFCRLTTSSIIRPRQRIGIPWSAKNLKYKYSTRINFSDKLHRKALKPRLSPSFQPVILFIATVMRNQMWSLEIRVVIRLYKVITFIGLLYAALKLWGDFDNLLGMYSFLFQDCPKEVFCIFYRRL